MSATDEEITGGDAANGVGLHSVVMRRRALMKRWRRVDEGEWKHDDGSYAHRWSCIGGSPARKVGWYLWMNGRWYDPFRYFDDLKSFHATAKSSA
jgi:hypothetical protein